VSNGAVSR